MTPLSPIVGALLCIAAATLGVLVFAAIQRRWTFSGYEELAESIESLNKALKGELKRQGKDLIINGVSHGSPVMVRISDADDRPAVSVQVKLPATFDISVTPVGVRAESGRILLRTNDSQLDSRFRVRTDRPAEVRMFLTPRTVETIKKLCCSSKTYLIVQPGILELSEMVVPTPDPSVHVLAHLEQVAALHKAMRAMPGSDRIKVEPIRRDRRVWQRAAIIICALALILTIYKTPSTNAQATTTAPKVNESRVLPIHASAVRDWDKWRVAEASDFDPSALALLRANGLPVGARLQASFAGGEHPTDAAYFLIGPNGERRVVVITQGSMRYDAQFPALSGIARFPKTSIANTDWKGKAPDPVDGDGVLLMRDPADDSTAMVVFLHNNAVVIGTPRNLGSISLR